MPKIFETKLGVANTSILDLKPNEPSVPALVEEEKSDFRKDFELAREGMLRNIKNIDEAIQHAFMIAKDTESAQSFLALNSLMKTMSDTSKDILELHQKEKNFNKTEEKKTSGDVLINNAVFAGTPKDLKNLIQNMKKEGTLTAPPSDDSYEKN